MVVRQNRGGGNSEENSSEGNLEKATAAVSGYEEFREQRIRENKERLQKLGILDLTLKLKPKGPPPKRPRKNLSDETKTDNPGAGSPRRSSRLKTVAPVSYVEIKPTGKRKTSEDGEIFIKEGSKPEVYTEEHEKLLGDCVESWTLGIDGYGDDGKRIYDGVKGETCHQCRQKTLGLHTHCSKCDLVQGQLCGDCLYMRYGENVREVFENFDWICPVCRGICNCSVCRLAKGWEPTGNLYRKVIKLGYKSVAHYLIQTRCSEINSDASGAEVVAEGSVPSAKDLPVDMEEEEEEEVHITDSERVNVNDVGNRDAVANGKPSRRSARLSRN